MRVLLLIALSTSLGGCILDRSGTRPDRAGDAGGFDAAGFDAAGFDAGPGERDAGPGGFDAGPGEDAGPDFDAGPREDAGVDAGPMDDAGYDAGVLDEDPPVTGGLLVHLDARRVDGAPGEPGDEEPSTWVDLSGGNDAECNNVAYEPDGIAPGRPSMYTNGDADSFCSFPIPDMRDFTIFVVFRNHYTRDDGDEWWNNACLVGGDASGVHDDGALYYRGGRIGFARRDNGVQFLDATSRADDAPHVATFSRVDMGGAVALTVDREAPVFDTAVAGRINRPDSWFLAAHETSGGRGRLANHYGEVLIYDRLLTPTEAYSVHVWLLGRWGIP